MRCKLYGNGNRDYRCCWCLHVKTGTVLLGIVSLVTQVAFLLVVSYFLLHPDALPSWVSSFEVSRLGVAPHGRGSSSNMMMHHKEVESGAGLWSDDAPGIKLADVMSDHSKDHMNHMSERMSEMDDDTRPLMMPPDHERMRKYHENMALEAKVGLDPEDKFFLILTIICCIISSELLLYGVYKGQPGQMMPFMGLQAFDFCATVLLVLVCFSDLPYLKHSIQTLPESFPWKSYLLSLKTDHLMLTVVLSAVALLIVKGYLMGMVWSCYKYLLQSASDRRRSTTADEIHSPENTQLLLPPKYEDIIEEDEASSHNENVADQPPAYSAA